MQGCSVPVVKISFIAQYRLLTLSAALLSLGIVSGCSSAPPKTTSKIHTVSSPSQESLLDASSMDSLESLLSATDMAAVEDNRLAILRYGDVWRRMRAGFKLDLDVSNRRIDGQRSWFITRQPYIDRLSARASRYLYYTVTEAERRGIPTELALLPIIESSYDPGATSNAAAAGMWQFIPSTGKIYGLRQNSLYDGRRDVVESTRAAYEFLTSLYNQFGSWELALASYNAGPGRVQQAINRNRAAGLPTDYWSLKLPTETMNYVPRFIAVAQIVNDPASYSVDFPSIANRPHFREVQLPGVVDLNLAASIAGISSKELFELNTGFRSSYTDPMAPMRLLIPASLSMQVDAKLRSMPTLAQTNPELLASLGPVGGATVLTEGGKSYNAQQAAVLMGTGSPQGSAVASVTQRAVGNTTSTVTKTALPTSAALVSSKTSTPSAPTNSIKTRVTDAKSAATTLVTQVKHIKTPVGSDALARFASQADIPSSPRIPVSVTVAPNLKPIVEPPISAAERDVISAANKANTVTTAQLEQEKKNVIAELKALEQEKSNVVAELQALAPEGTQVVDPLDGKIQLTAIQTSQSVANAKGQELKINYEKPYATVQKNTVAINNNKPAASVTPVVSAEKPKGERSLYTVQSGDSLTAIAARYGLNWRDIASWNQIDASKPLFRGTNLYLYGAKKIAQPKPTQYVVQAGDTLIEVAARFDLTPSQLASMNDGLSANSNLLRGATLNLVERTSERNKASTAQVGKNSAAVTPHTALVNYTVKRGEYLKQIAERHDLTYEELAAINNLPSTSGLLVGQVLKVPADNDVASVSAKRASSSTTKNATTTYVVKSGDTLSKISAQFGSNNGELAKLNDISATAMVLVGQKLTVPDTEVKAKADKPTHYRVQSGDTLIGVANGFGLTPQQLAELNGLRPTSNLIAGVDLKLVAEGSEKASSTASGVDAANSESTASTVDTETYTVRRGESLTGIAQKYSVSLSELAALNNLSSKTMVRIGQKLSVPKLTTEYKVKRGDTLIHIASRHGVSTEELAHMNQISPRTNVQIGQVLTVPTNNNRSL